MLKFLQYLWLAVVILVIAKRDVNSQEIKTTNPEATGCADSGTTRSADSETNSQTLLETAPITDASMTPGTDSSTISQTDSETLSDFDLTTISTTEAANSTELAGLNESCEVLQCMPGLKCNSKKICKIQRGTCLGTHWGDALWKPACDEDNTWSAVQCKGEFLNGRCFCYNSAGSRIFGWSWWNSADNMTCACSRRRQELENLGRTNITLHCVENGNYEELQCDSGLCWCVEPTTGVPTQRAYPESLIRYLPCYDEDRVGLQYLRQCESKLIARSEILEKLEQHGRRYTHIDSVFCEADGGYGPYLLDGTSVYCIWKNSTKIGIYQTTITEPDFPTMNCNCAKDYYMYTEAGLKFSLKCQGNGNYMPQQSSNGYPFCVDSDGFATTTLGSFGEILECKIS